MATVFASGAAQLDGDGKVIPVVDVRPTPPMPSAGQGMPPAEPGTDPERMPPAGEEPAEGEAPPVPEDEPLEDDEGEGEEGELVEADGRAGRPSRRERRRTYAQGLQEQLRAQQDEIAWLRARLTQPQPEQAPVPPEAQPDPTEPQEHWYGTQTDFLKAWALWAYRKEEAARQQVQAQQVAATMWEQREAEGRAKYRDYDQVVDRLQIAGHLAPYVAATVRAEETGADLLYYFGTHPQDMQKLNRMDARAALVWLGQLQAQLASTPAKPPPTRHAPTNGQRQPPPHQPMQPVQPGAARPVTGFQPGMDLTAYDAMRREERKARGLRP